MATRTKVVTSILASLTAFSGEDIFPGVTVVVSAAARTGYDSDSVASVTGPCVQGILFRVSRASAKHNERKNRAKSDDDLASSVGIQGDLRELRRFAQCHLEFRTRE